MHDTDLFEQSFNIAWSVLERAGELGEPNDTSRFLFDTMADTIRKWPGLALTVRLRLSYR